MEEKTRWLTWCNRYPGLHWLDGILRGYSQVMFQNNPLTGLLFFAAVFVSAWQASALQIAWGCLLSTLIATLAARLLVSNKTALNSGMLGYNGCLVGAALPGFLAPSPWLWLGVIFSALMSVIITLGVNRLLKTWHIAALTAPFVLTTWTLLLASYAFLNLAPLSLPQPLPVSVPHPGETPHAGVIIPATLDGISQVFLCHSPLGGVLFLLGLGVSSRWAMMLAVIGSLIAVLIAMLAGANSQPIASGMYAFSPVLTAIALGSVFNQPSVKTLCYTLIGVVFTVLMQGAFNTLLKPLGIPTLTMPFVIVSWLFLLANQWITPPSTRPPKGI
ncbi:urea transporter [Erwinia sp. OLTSP20]|uniref:urea transporter n=1 Tax=unclassified Erwinia TaxID=2622719 RepID=UPI000C1793D3|nr:MULTISPECIES: urea transporter [unclassified Erwinia]PIJ50130.1 urea transporter [Erwinia sp. OAMSP11]PIJ71896.1 urea transporter [Erwinia sp. OLSSP12]PIJ81098.1 urea transporter [Erwinia sp. OLCASP19]PIJ83528.1 urea transporter [Erwinia sp. OLMTSP26]PIJ86143.1 urea transporter [Erwinia sp. OLMDSP33]